MCWKVITLLVLAAVVVNCDPAKPGLYDAYYCHSDLQCDNYRTDPVESKMINTHVMCKNQTVFAKMCQKAKVMDLTDAMREQILEAHNILRNVHALGAERYKLGKIKLITGELVDVKELINDPNGIFDKSLTKMATLEWDNELELLALQNAVQCDINHDHCHRTKRFHFAGQNIGECRHVEELSIPFLINRELRKMYSEELKFVKMAEKSPIASYYTNPDEKKRWGHFTQLMRDDAYKVGCALVQSYVVSDGKDKIRYNLACDYSTGNNDGIEIYKTGKLGSECPSKQYDMNPKYKGLCSQGQDYSKAEIVIPLYDKTGKPTGKTTTKRIYNDGIVKDDKGKAIPCPAAEWAAKHKPAPKPMPGYDSILPKKPAPKPAPKYTERQIVFKSKLITLPNFVPLDVVKRCKDFFADDKQKVFSEIFVDPTDGQKKALQYNKDKM